MHFKGLNDQERYNNTVLNELTQIRQLLERIAQTVEHPKGDVNHESGNRRPGRPKRHAQ